MSTLEPSIMTSERQISPAVIGTLTWRYLGERAVADAAYCVRFGVVVAPEPSEYAGVLSYAVPSDVPRR